MVCRLVFCARLPATGWQPLYLIVCFLGTWHWTWPSEHTLCLLSQIDTPLLSDPSSSLRWSSVLPLVWQDIPSPPWGFPGVAPGVLSSLCFFLKPGPQPEVPWDPQLCQFLLPSPASCPVWSSPFLGPAGALWSLGLSVCRRASQRQLLFLTRLLGGAF